MPRLLRWIVKGAATVLLFAFLWVAWQLVRVQAAARHVIWQTKEGGLTMTYFPLKRHAIVFVGNDYVATETRTWQLTDPGGSNWILGASNVPSPKQLFEEAWIGRPDPSQTDDPDPDPRFGLSSSTADGLVRLYDVASDDQKGNILWQLEDACERKSSFCQALAELRAREPGFTKSDETSTNN